MKYFKLLLLLCIFKNVFMYVSFCQNIVFFTKKIGIL